MSPGLALSLTLWRGAKVGHAGAVFIGLCVAAPLWLLLFKGAYDEPSWVLGSLLIPFAPFLQSALVGGQLGPALRRPDTQPWARRGLLFWLLAVAFPWWLALVVPAALLNQTTYGATVWLWFSAVLAASIAVGMSLAWARWVVLGVGGLVMLASFSSEYWRPSDLEAWLLFLKAPSMMLPLSGLLFAGAAVVLYKVRQALTGVIPSINALAPTDWTAAFLRATDSATPRPGRLSGLLDPPEKPFQHWLTIALLGALILAPYLTIQALFPHYNQPSIVMLAALMPAHAFGRDLLNVRSPFPARGLLLPNGLRRHDLLFSILRLQLSSPPLHGTRLARLSLALGLAWGMQWPWPAMLSLCLAGAASVLAEFCFVAVQRDRSNPSAWRHYVVAGLLFAVMVGAVNGLSDKLQASITQGVLFAAALVSLCSVAIIATQVRRWRRFIA